MLPAGVLPGKPAPPPLCSVVGIKPEEFRGNPLADRATISCKSHEDRNILIRAANTDNIFTRYQFPHPNIPKYEFNLCSVLIFKLIGNVRVSEAYKHLPPSATLIPKEKKYISSGDFILFRSPQEAASWDSANLEDLIKIENGNFTGKLQFYIRLHRCDKCGIWDNPLKIMQGVPMCAVCFHSDTDNLVHAHKHMQHSTCTSCNFARGEGDGPSWCQGGHACVTKSKLISFYRNELLNQIRHGREPSYMCVNGKWRDNLKVRCKSTRVSTTKRVKMHDDEISQDPSPFNKFRIASWNVNGAKHRKYDFEKIFHKNKLHVLGVQDIRSNMLPKVCVCVCVCVIIQESSMSRCKDF